MTEQTRLHMLHMLASQLQDNQGQRLTSALINGICTTLDATWPKPEADPQQSLPKIPPG